MYCLQFIRQHVIYYLSYIYYSIFHLSLFIVPYIFKFFQNSFCFLHVFCFGYMSYRFTIIYLFSVFVNCQFHKSTKSPKFTYILKDLQQRHLYVSQNANVVQCFAQYFHLTLSAHLGIPSVLS